MTSLAFDSIEIHDFKSFRGDHEFQLARPPGLYYIAGRNLVDPQLGSNGVGKSTIWDALLWALFGKTGRDNRPATAVIPWGFEKGTCSVSLCFRRGDEEYQLVRSRRPNDLRLRAGRVDRTITDDDVSRLLGMTEETFRRTVALGQFGTLFLDLLSEQQSRMFSDALSLDLWIRASRCASVARDAKESATRQAHGALAAVKGRLSELTANLAVQEAALAAYADEQSAWIKRVEVDLATATTELSGLIESASLPALRSRKQPQPVARLAAALDAARSALETLRKEMAQVEPSAIRARTAIRDEDHEIARYQKAIGSNRACPECGQPAPLKDLKAKLAVARAARAAAVAGSDAARARIQKLDALIAVSEARVSHLDGIMRSATRVSAQIDGYRVRLDEIESAPNPHRKQVADMTRRRAELEGQIEELTERAHGLERESGDCAFWVDAFKEIRLKRIDDTLDDLEITTDRHVESLGLEGWSIRFQTERETKGGNVTTAFTTLLYPPGSSDAIRWQSYSGGEAQRWQMATAFGLSEVLLARAGIEPNIEVYDEPTRGLSAHGIEDLLDCLAARAIDLKRCIYVTEHHSLERGMFTGMIMVEKTRSGSYIIEE